MEEKKLLEGGYSYIQNLSDKFKTSGKIVAIGVIVLVLGFIMNGSDNAAAFGMSHLLLWCSLLLLIPAGLYFIIIAIDYAYCKTTKITVTDKRVYGTALGKQIDLPLDSISSVGTTWWFRGLSVSTASGNIKFYGLDNRDNVYSVINKLLIERQKKASLSFSQSPITQTSSNADELKKYSDLLVQGIISQEEFDAKKKQLLGL